MRRFTLAIIVALLTFSASGVTALVVAEPCNFFEEVEKDDDACPPMCVTCGCCAQAVEPVVLLVASFPEALVSDITPLIPHLPNASSRDILHVPKLRGA